MKIEPLKTATIVNESGAAEILRMLKPGQAIRLKTAQEWRNLHSCSARIGNERGIKFRSINDGDDDVLVYIKEVPQKTS